MDMTEAVCCRSCQAIRGEISLTNVPRIHEGRYWILEHVHPSSVKGWIVIVLKRHCGALHELETAEFLEFQQLLQATSHALHQVLGTEKEYVMQFAEGEGFHHVHFHVIARLPQWPDKFKGPRVFRAMDPEYGEPLSAAQLAPFVNDFRVAFLAQLAAP
jgi:diadenosine tetraphosphate (Ap4A) HIT family hydrolase